MAHMSHLIWIYTICQDLFLGTLYLMLKELRAKQFNNFSLVIYEIISIDLCNNVGAVGSNLLESKAICAGTNPYGDDIIYLTVNGIF